MSLTLHYDFKSNPTLQAVKGPTLDFTRATTAMMKDADGYLREVQDGEARFDGTVWSQNLFLTSDATVADVGANGNIADGGKTLPSEITNLGISNVIELQGDLGNAFGYEPGGNINLKSGRYWMMSTYVALGDGTEPSFASTTAGDGNIVFNIGGIIGTNGYEDWGVEHIGGDWYRMWAVGLSVTDANSSGPLQYNAQYIFGNTRAYVAGWQAEDVSGAWDSENLQPQSSNLTHADWIKTRCTVTAGAADPDGGTNAFQIKENVGTSTTYLPQAPVHVTQLGSFYIHSIKVKSNGRNIRMSLAAAGYPNNSYVNFDLDAGTVGFISGAGNAGSIIDLGNGWYQCIVTQKADETSAACRMSYNLMDGANPTYNGDGSSGVFLYQPHMERQKPNQTAPGTYTATTTAAVTNYSPSAYIETTTAAVTALSGENDGLLVEEARTNICLQSEDILTTWTTSNATPAADQTTAPDGSLTADQLIDDSSTGTGAVGTLQTITTATSTAYALSVYLKADQLDWAQILFAGSGALVIRQWYDLTNGAVGASPGADVTDSGIEDYGNGWFRCWLTFTSDAIDTTGNLTVRCVDSDGDTTVDLDGTSSIFVWGAQIEAGEYPTSYMPTLAASVTRNFEQVDTTDVSWFDRTQGSFYVEFNKLLGSDTYQGYGAHISAGAANYISSYCVGSDAVGRVWSNNVAQLNVTTGGNEFTDAAYVKTVVGWGLDAVHYAEGVQGGYEASIDSPLAATYTLDIGRDHNGPELDGHIKELRYYNERLADEVLLDMSNGIFPGGSGGGVLRHRAKDASLWNQMMKLKQDDADAERLVRQYLNS